MQFPLLVAVHVLLSSFAKHRVSEGVSFISPVRPLRPGRSSRRTGPTSRPPPSRSIDARRPRSARTPSVRLPTTNSQRRNPLKVTPLSSWEKSEDDTKICDVSNVPVTFGTATRRHWLEHAAASALTAAAAAAKFSVQPAAALTTESALTSVNDVFVQSSLPSSLCDPTVSSYRRGSRTVHIVGTAHISSVSAKLAGRVVREVMPDAVYVELDLRRIGRAFRQGQPIAGVQIAYQDEKGLQVGTVASRPPGPASLIAKIIHRGSDLIGSPIRSVYKRLEDEGFLAGEEFIVAVEEGLDAGAVIVLGDRSMDVTLRRISAAIAKTDLRKLTELDKKLEQTLKANIPELEQWQKSPETFGADELRDLVEAMKTKETTKTLMNAFKAEVPEIHNALVAERDIYMANGLNNLNQFQTIVAVIGLGHLDGVEANLKALGWSKMKKKCT